MNQSTRSVAYRSARIVVALGAVLFQIALAFYYIGLAVLVVPAPTFFAFWLAWAIEFGIVLWLAIRRPWLSPIVPALSLIAIWLVLRYGETNLGWGP
jgi:hypothetical protein